MSCHQDTWEDYCRKHHSRRTHIWVCFCIGLAGGTFIYLIFAS